MRQMEEHKYLKPKFSECVTRVAEYVGLPQRVEIGEEYGEGESQVRDSRRRKYSQSHSKFNTKKFSQAANVVRYQEVRADSSKGEDQKGFHRSQRTPQTEKEFRTTKITVKNNHQAFYTTHERRIRKMNNTLQKRLLERETNKSSELAKMRSITEPQPYSAHAQFPKQKDCIDLKVLRQAQEQLKKGQKPEWHFRITE